jgi:hypothetical protein
VPTPSPESPLHSPLLTLEQETGSRPGSLQRTSAPTMKTRSLRLSDEDPIPEAGFRSPASAPACRSRRSTPSRTAASGRGSRSLLLLHQHQQCRTPLFPLQGNPRHLGVPSRLAHSASPPTAWARTRRRRPLRKTPSSTSQIYNPPTRRRPCKENRSRRRIYSNRNRRFPFPSPTSPNFRSGYSLG